MKNKILILIIISFIYGVVNVNAQNVRKAETLKYVDVSSSIQMKDILYIKDTEWKDLYSIPEHPSFDSLRTKSVTADILNMINLRKNNVGDSLRTADLFYCWLPYFEWLKYIDPHYDISLIVPSKYCHIHKESEEIAERNNELRTQAKIIPASTITINDTLIIKTSLCPELKSRDIITSINGINVRDILMHSFKYRHDDIPTLLNYYYFHGVDSTYDVELIRDGIPIKTHFDGYANMYAYFSQISRIETTESSHYFEKENVGYVKIPKFYPDNSRLFKFVRKEIIGFKKKGCADVIIDLRNNPGGSGHLIERFLAMFINKPTITISRHEWVKISEQTINDYPDLNGHKIGDLVSLHDSPSLRPFNLNNKFFEDGITTYVIMDQGTSSTAAALCNILQYNKGAVLVGEPLLHNAYVYGDVIEGKRLEKRLEKPFLGLLCDDCISTTFSEVYTNAENGILMPDIYIPYTACEYIKCDDAVLNKLLDIITNRKNRL